MRKFTMKVTDDTGTDTITGEAAAPSDYDVLVVSDQFQPDMGHRWFTFRKTMIIDSSTSEDAEPKVNVEPGW